MSAHSSFASHKLPRLSITLGASGPLSGPNDGSGNREESVQSTRESTFLRASRP